MIGDGSINCLRYPDGFRTLAAQVNEVLSDDGLFVLRCFIQPAVKESPEDILGAILREPIPSFHHFKLRLLMAMQPDVRQGIAVDDVYRLWMSCNLDESLPISRVGWEKQAIDTIHLYRGTNTVLTFPTLPELRSVLQEYLQGIAILTPSYSLGTRCPILLWRPRRNR